MDERESPVVPAGDCDGPRNKGDAQERAYRWVHRSRRRPRDEPVSKLDGLSRLQFRTHKGYNVSEHRTALKRLGAYAIH